MIEQTIQLVPSAYIHAMAARANAELQPDLGAMQAMAAKFDVGLADEQRVLLLAAGQHPSVKDSYYVVSEYGPVPTVESPEDIVVTLDTSERGYDVLDEDVLTQGVARALNKIKRERQESIMKRTGTGLFVGGMAVSGTGYGTGIDWLEKTGYGITATGLALVAYGANRGDGKLPDLSQFRPPITVGTH